MYTFKELLIISKFKQKEVFYWKGGEKKEKKNKRKSLVETSKYQNKCNTMETKNDNGQNHEGKES